MTYTGRRSSPLPPNWGAIRLHILTRDWYCQWGSQSEDRAEPSQCMERAVEVDHIGPPDEHRLMFLRGLCKYHHSVRTGRQGAAGKLRVMFTRKRPKDPHPG